MNQLNTMLYILIACSNICFLQNIFLSSKQKMVHLKFLKRFNYPKIYFFKIELILFYFVFIVVIIFVIFKMFPTYFSVS